MIKIRPSSLDSYVQCPKSTRNKLVEGYKSHEKAHKKFHISATVGTSVHLGAMEAVKDLSKHLQSKKYYQEKALDSLSEAMTDEHELDALTPTRKDADRQVKQLVGIFLDDHVPTRPPLLVETQLKAEVTDEIVLIGSPDYVTFSGPCDLKTGRMKTFLGQLGAYNLLCEANKICSPIDNKIIHLPRSAVNKTPVSNVLVYDAEHATSIAKSILRAIIEDLEKPLDQLLEGPSAGFCSAHFCDLFGTEHCTSWRYK
jgi:hypothetical protein